jgi:hypothetical protein
MGSFSSEYPRMRNTYKSFFLLSHLSNTRNPGYITIFIIFVTALLRNNVLSKLFQMNDMIINCTHSYNFQQYPKYSPPECCHSSRYGILRYIRSTYKTSANTLYEKYAPHISRAKILDGKSLIPFWAKVNTRYYGDRLKTLYTLLYMFYTKL